MMDESYDAVVSLSLNSNGFDTFQCDNNDGHNQRTLCINIPEFIKSLNHAESNETFIMSVLDDDNIIGITLEPPNKTMVIHNLKFASYNTSRGTV